MTTDLVVVDEQMHQEEVAKIFSRRSLLAVPVVTPDGRMKGIVTVDDIVKVVHQEATKDIQKMGGSEALDEPYLKIKLFKMFKKRGGWLMALFIGEMFTASAMGYFQDEIAKAVVLALFVPLIISSGGNSGSQAFHTYGMHAILVALTVAISLVVIVLWGGLAGSILPFIMRKLGFDPASACAPFVATFVDVTGLIIYFTLAKVILAGTLL